jgi:hypothetical protein
MSGYKLRTWHLNKMRDKQGCVVFSELLREHASEFLA